MVTVSAISGFLQQSRDALKTVRLRENLLRRGGLIALYVLAWGVAAWFAQSASDLELFFLPSARIALGGHPLQVYSLRLQGYPNANGPLSLLPLTSVAWLAARLGWLDSFFPRRMLIMAAFSVFSLLMAWEGVAALDRLRGSILRSVPRLLAFAAFACAPGLWRGVLIYGHVEYPLALWLILWAVRALAEQQSWRAGILMGLALLARTTSSIYLIPLVIIAISVSPGWRWVKLLVGALGTAALGLLPFVLADAHDVVYSLATFRGGLPIGGGSILLLATGTPYAWVAQHDDAVLVLLGALIASCVVVLRRTELDVRGGDVYGLLALVSLAFPLFTKTLWPYYFFDVYVFIAIWTLATPNLWRIPRQRWLLLLPVGCAALACTPVFNIWAVSDPATLRAESIAMFVVVGALALGLAAWLCGEAPHISVRLFAPTAPDST